MAKVQGVEDEFKAPEVDLSRIRGLTQEILAPTVSKIRRSVQRVQAGRAATPTARGVQIREAIRGGGEALGAAQAGATKAAFALYSPEFQSKMQEAMIRFKTAQAEKVREEERRRRTAPRRTTYSRLNDYEPFKTRGVRTAPKVAPRTHIIAPKTDYTSQLLGETSPSLRIAEPKAPSVKSVETSPAPAIYDPQELLEASFARI